MSDEMKEIVAEFVTEAMESLDRVDPLCVELEAKGSDPAIVNEVFRCVHTLKGAAGFLGFQEVVDVAHGTESLLKKLRDGHLAMTRAVADAILHGIDALRRLVHRIGAGEGGACDVAPVLGELAAALESTANGASPSAAPAPEGLSAAGGTSPLAVPAPANPPAADATPPPERAGEFATLRVDVERVDKVMDLAGEVVLARNRLLALAGRLADRNGGDPVSAEVGEAVSFLDLVTSDLQLAVMRMRMQPLRRVFGKFPRLVRDLSGALGKEVALEMTGEEVEVDRSVIERLADPMVHLLRNAVDHGLEAPKERLERGKPARGTIRIGASQKGSQIVIEVSDDGRGIDLARVRRKAAERGLVTAEEAARMGDDAAVGLIFLPGFSTRDAATELSGRGVGMDVVKTNVARLNGFVEVTTRPGLGTTFRITIPLTLAIVRALVVRAAGRRYAVPLALVAEIHRVPPSGVARVAGRPVVVIRERVHPYVDLAAVLGGAKAESGEGEAKSPEGRYALLVCAGEQKFCVGVEGLFGEEEIVIKPVDGVGARRPYVAGATVDGEGRVVLVLDMPAVFRGALEGCAA